MQVNLIDKNCTLVLWPNFKFETMWAWNKGLLACLLEGNLCVSKGEGWRNDSENKEETMKIHCYISHSIAKWYSSHRTLWRTLWNLRTAYSKRWKEEVYFHRFPISQESTVVGQAHMTVKQAPTVIPYCNIREAIEQGARDTWQGPEERYHHVAYTWIWQNF